MTGISQDIVRAIQVGSLAFVCFGLLVVARCTWEAGAGVLTRLWRPRRRRRASLRSAMRAYARGDLERAYAHLHRVLARNPEHYRASIAMWDVGRDAGYPEHAESALLRAIHREVRDGDRVTAVQHWLELASHARGDVAAEPSLLVRIGSMLEEANRRAEARRAYERALSSCSGMETARIASRVACAAVDLDREMAEEAAWRALGCDDLDLSDRLGLQALLRRLYPTDADRPALELDAATS